MSYTRFDRARSMSSVTRKEIMDILREVEGFDLKNMLYGLYDGYLYENLVLEAQRVKDVELYTRIVDVYFVCSSYPLIYEGPIEKMELSYLKEYCDYKANQNSELTEDIMGIYDEAVSSYDSRIRLYDGTSEIEYDVVRMALCYLEDLTDN
jgi:hypothetical protein